MWLRWQALVLIGILATLLERSSASADGRSEPRQLQEETKKAEGGGTTEGGSATTKTEGGTGETKKEGGTGETKKEGEKKEGRGGEGEEKPDPASVAAATLFMACIAIVMILLCLLNSSREGIKNNSYKLVNAATTVFMAVLVYSATNEIHDAWFGPEEKEGANEGGRIASALILTNIWCGVIVFFNVLYGRFGWHKSQSYEAVNQVLAHIASFVCKELCNSFMHADPFDNNAGMASLAVLILFAAVIFYGLFTDLVIKLVVPEKNADKVKEKQDDMQIDAASVAVGFGIVQVVRFADKNRLPSAELVEATGKTNVAISAALFGCSVGCFMLSFVLLKVQLALNTSNKYLEMLKMTCVLAHVWFLIFWGDMAIVTLPANKFMGLILMSCLYSAWVILSIISVEFITAMMGVSDKSEGAEKGLDILISAGSWLVALPWEQTFDVASEAVSVDWGWSEWATRLVVSVTLFAIMTPSWYFYILPHVWQQEEEDTGDAEVPEKNAKFVPIKPMALGANTNAVKSGESE